ncbi:MAG: ABC transporter ATP-binding protein [Akkermansiaceae bacterium]
MLILLIHMYQAGRVTIGDFIFIMSLCRAVVYPVWWLATQMIEFSGDVGKCQQALSIITPEHDIVDIENASELKVAKGEIRFDQVNFEYHKSSHVFQNVSVTIPAGQKVGLVGFSGAGKSTFVNLLLRFYDVDSGKIQIDGENISEVTQDSLRSHLSMIPQDTSLFHRSLMDNIRYGREGASDEEVIEAAKQAYCDEFIQELPENYEALVGERGVKLSGGQRQRIAIARAILKNAPILILDEATSALDSVTEKYIQRGLDTLMEGRTAIVIAHRLSTLSQMDRILVFDKGKIIEDGSPEELISNDGHYANMWNMQAGGFLASD